MSNAIDGGITVLHDAGMIPDGGMAMLRDAGFLTDGGEGTDGGSMMEIPAADAVTQSGTRLKAKYYRTPDGAQSLIGWYDSQLQKDCSFTKMGDGSTRCIPATAYVGYFFSDPSCGHALAHQATCASTPVYAVTAAPSSCVGGIATISGLGQAVTPTALYSLSGSTCISAGASLQQYLSTYSFWEVGQAVPASTFVEATVAMD